MANVQYDQTSSGLRHRIQVPIGNPLFIDKAWSTILLQHMEKAHYGCFGDRSTSDINVRLQNKKGRPEWFYCHSSVLIKGSKYFADWLSRRQYTYSPVIEIHCLGSEYDNYVKLLELLYVSEESLLDSWNSVKSAIGVLQASVALQCGAVTKSCVQFLEAVPWEANEEEDIMKVVTKLGPEVMPLLARIQPVEKNATKNVFLSAINFATTINSSFPPFSDELKTSAQEQVDYMLLEDEDTALVEADEDVKLEVSKGLAKIFTTLEMAINMLNPNSDNSPEAAEEKFMHSLSDLEWICNLLPKMELMNDFVSRWIFISDRLLAVLQEDKYSSSLWSVKAKLIELTGKVLDAVGYGSVVLPTPSRFTLLKTWLPYIRKMKPLLDSKAMEDETFPYKMDNDLCQNIEGAITSLVLALPSNDQADILTDWMKMTEQFNYPDLTEAFEVWCYRSKTAKRRLMVGLNGRANPAVSL